MDIFDTATGHMGHSSNNSETALFRLEELFSALHHSGESRVISHLIYCMLINPHRTAAILISRCINHVFIFPENCECVEVTLGSPKLFCSAEYDYGKCYLKEGIESVMGEGEAI